jgi:cell division protein FtsZ
MGTAMMGTGQAVGERRAIEAAEAAIHNPLLDEVSLRGARGLLLSITGGKDLTLYEVDEAASRVREEVDPEANIIVGATFDDDLKDAVRVSIVATGLDPRRSGEPQARPAEARGEARIPSPEHRSPQSHPYAYAFPPQGEDSLQPQPQHAEAAPRRTGNEGVKQRLSEAMRGLPDSMTDRGDWPEEPAVSTYRDGVAIEDAMPELPSLAGRSFDGGEPPLAPVKTPVQTGRDFRPAPPREVREPVRQMPSIDQFPQPAQRIYNAQKAREEQAEQASRKQGFFQRWTAGRSRRAAGQEPVEANPDSRITSEQIDRDGYRQPEPEANVGPAKNSAQPSHEQDFRARRSGQHPARRGDDEQRETRSEDTETSMFFRSSKK